MNHNVKDPVCGMSIEVDDSTLRSDWQGQTYYFCATACKEKFDGAPEQYAEQKECCGKHAGHHGHHGHHGHGSRKH